MDRRFAIGALGFTVLAAACGASSGRQFSRTLTFYEREGVTIERGDGSWQDIPLYVVLDADVEYTIQNRRILEIRDRLDAINPRRRNLLRSVEVGNVRGDTIGGFLWRPSFTREVECTVFSGERADPPASGCQRAETTFFERWPVTELQRMTQDVGGDAILLAYEDHSGGFRGIRGFIVRCNGEC